MQHKRTDWILVIAYVCLSVIGLLMIYSASSFRLLSVGAAPTALFNRQLLFTFMSWALILLLQKVRSTILLGRTLAIGLIGFGVVTLLLAHVPFFGVTVNGAQRWVSIGGLQFQPSEIVNVGMILYLAHYFKEPKSVLREIKQPISILFICCLLILLQPKVAGVFILLFLAFIMITTVQVPVKLTVTLFVLLLLILILTGGLVLLLGQYELLPSMFEHVYNRIRLVGDPFSDPYGQGFQMIHSYYALFNGGLGGLGLGNSITKKGFLPVAETDFIFSVMIEELGLLFGVFVIGLLFVMIIRLFKYSATCKNDQVGLIFLGTATLLLMQTSINIASILGLMPMTGVPLPFVSYGGSSYFILSFAFGLCLKLAREEGNRYAVVQTA